MPDALSDIAHCQYLRYLLSFLLGLVGSYAVQRLIDERKETRVRRGMREALATELIHNLQVLDAYERTFKQGQTDPPNAGIRWSLETLTTTALNRILDLASGTLLTESEQLKLPLIEGQLTELIDRLRDAHADLLRYPASRHEIYQHVLSRYLAYPATNMVDLLCQLFEYQALYSSERTMQVAKTVLPLLQDANFRPSHLWRTSDLATDQVPTNPFVAWRNDAPEKVPRGVQVVEVRPPEGNYGTVEWGRPTRFERLRVSLKRRRRGRDVERALAWTADRPPGQQE